MGNTDDGWQVGSVVDGVYEVRGILGEGGMGTVYRVHHRGWNMELAVKSPKAKIFARGGGREAFVREAETWVNLGLHANIVTCHFVRTLGGIPRVFAELVSGGSLQDWIDDRRLYAGTPRQVLGRILDLAIQFAWGLAHAHEAGLVHQDIKPDNVMVTTDGVAKVTDFGLAKARASASGIADVSGPIDQTLMVPVGGMTPAYCSPEQGARGALSRRSDTWSWGVSILAMLTGRGHDRLGSQADQTLARCAAGGDDAWALAPPQALLELLENCLQPNPDDRPRTMTDVARRLRDIYAQSVGQPYRRTNQQAADAIDPALAEANLNNRAVSMIELGRWDEAATLLERAADGSENPEIVYNHCLLTMRRTGTTSLAGLVERMWPGPAPELAGYLLGALFLEAGQLGEAIDWLAPVPGAEAWNARAIALLLHSETRPAVLSFQQAVGERPDRLDMLRNLALGYYYDGDLKNALRVFERIDARAVMDAEDTVRFATVLSAADRPDEARRRIARALAAPDQTSVVWLTSAELQAGASTFLPDVQPAGGNFDGQALAQRVVQAEPANLRARVDAETLPRRYGFTGVGRARQGLRLCPASDRASDVAGCMAHSHPSMGKSGRWGQIGSFKTRLLISFLAGVPAILLGTCISVLLRLVLLFQWRPGQEFAGLWSDLPYLAGIAIFIAARPAPSRSLATAVPAVLCGCTVFLFGIAPPEELYLIVYMIPALSCLFIAWEYFYRAIIAWIRAASPTAFGCPVAAPGEAAQDQPQRQPAPAISRAERFKRRLAPAWRAAQWNHSTWIIFLIPQLCFGLLAAIVLPFVRGGGADALFMARLVISFSVLAILIVAPLAPKWFLYFNRAWSVASPLAAGGVLVKQIGTIGALVMLVAGGGFFILNEIALRRCVPTARLCQRCRKGDWDVRQVIDPLNIRRYAAPWRILQADPAGGGQDWQDEP